MLSKQAINGIVKALESFGGREVLESLLFDFKKGLELLLDSEQFAVCRVGGEKLIEFVRLRINQCCPGIAFDTETYAEIQLIKLQLDGGKSNVGHRGINREGCRRQSGMLRESGIADLREMDVQRVEGT